MCVCVSLSNSDLIVHSCDNHLVSCKSQKSYYGKRWKMIIDRGTDNKMPWRPFCVPKRVATISQRKSMLLQLDCSCYVLLDFFWIWTNEHCFGWPIYWMLKCSIINHSDGCHSLCVNGWNLSSIFAYRCKSLCERVCVRRAVVSVWKVDNIDFDYWF